MALPTWMVVLLPLAVLLAVIFFGWHYARRGTTAAHRAASFGDVGRLGALLSASPTLVHGEDLFGWLPLQYAAHWGQLDSARVLLEHGADANRGHVRSPLHCAAAEGHCAMVDLLLDHGARIDTPSPEDGATPLHNAVIGRHVDVVRLLLNRGAAVDARTKSDWTACHLAAAAGDVDVVEVLSDFGANWQLINAGGHTPLELARHNGCQGVIEFVLRRAESGKSSPDQAVQGE